MTDKAPWWLSTLGKIGHIPMAVREGIIAPDDGAWTDGVWTYSVFSAYPARETTVDGKPRRLREAVAALVRR